MSHIIGYIIKVAIDKDVHNQLNFVSWLIDLKLIMCGVMCKKSTCEIVICICVCIYMNRYLIMRKIIKKIDTLRKTKVGYSL